MQPNVERTTSKLVSSKGRSLGVAFHELDLHARLGRQRPSLVEQRRHDVEPGHRAAALGRADRSVARATCHVEDPLALLDAHVVEDHLTHVPAHRRDRAEVALLPYQAIDLGHSESSFQRFQTDPNRPVTTCQSRA